MNKIYLIVFIAIRNFCFAQGTWTQKAHFPGLGKEYPFSFSVGAKGYTGTGRDSIGTMAKDFWEYDPATNLWTQKADYAGGRRFVATGFSIGAKGYAGLGDDSVYTEQQDFWEYDPAINIWTQKANFGGGTRRGAVGFSIDSMGYFCTGGTSTFYNDLWQYNPGTNLWTQKTSMPGSVRTESNGFVIGTNAYIIGGWDSGNLRDLWQYNSLTDTWLQKTTFPDTARCDAVAFTICNKGYYGMGDYVNGTYAGDLWLYDEPSNSWTQKANFIGVPRDEPAFFAIGGKGYIGLGGTGPQYSDFYEFTPDSACVLCVPTANFRSSDTNFCSESGKCISFTNLSSPCATSWHWIFFGATPDTSNLQNPDSICYYTPGTYPVVLIASNGNGSDTLNVYPMITFANLPPPPTVTIIGGDTLISSNGASYQWYFNGSPIAGAIDSFYIAHVNGTYSVQVTDNLGCNSLSSGIFISGLPSFSFGEELGLSIHPNPVKEELIIDGLTPYASPKERGARTAIEIYNVLGERVYAEKATDSKKETINCKQLPSGIYFVRLIDDSGSYSAKFVKE